MCEFPLQLVVAMTLLVWQVGWVCMAAASVVAGLLVPIEAHTSANSLSNEGCM